MRRLVLLFSVLLTCPATGAPVTDAQDRPSSVLIHAPRHSPDQWRGWVDLEYLRELRGRGIEVDYTDRHEDLTWDRLQRFDALVLYVCPLERGRYYDNTPDRPPYRDEFVALVERFLAEGGGVLLLARSLNADESFLPLLRNWGARIPDERIVDPDPSRLMSLPRMRGVERLWFTDNVADSPVSEGVRQVWLPLTKQYAAAETMPILVSADWQVVLRGAAGSRSVPVDRAEESLPAPPDRVVREDGVDRPDLFAVRRYKAGRIAFGAIWPQYSIGQGTRWLYERRVLDAGAGGRTSDFGRLIENTLRWLAAPRRSSERASRARVSPQRYIAPNLREGAGEEFVRATLRGYRDRVASALDPKPRGRLFRGLFGAQTALGSGKGSVEDYALQARRSGLDFVVFLEDFSRLDPDRLRRLREECLRHSSSDLRLYPGYRMETNAGNRIFFFGPGVRLPDADLVWRGRLNQQQRNPLTSAHELGTRFLDWIHYRVLQAGDVNVGYYGFSRPGAQPLWDLRFYSVAAVRRFDDGRVVEDHLEAYLAAAAGTIPPVPVALALVGSPVALRKAAAAGAVTYAQAQSLGELWTALSYADQVAAPNVFPSDGPTIEIWPDTVRYYTFAAEDSVAEAARMPVPLRVSSTLGLKEVRIYDGDRLFRRFLPRGERRFELVLELPASVQRNLVLVVEDLSGGRAISYARRNWKGGSQAPVFCGDRLNHCDAAPLLARGPGRFEVARTPPIRAGHTWDGGPDGERPILDWSAALRPTVVSERGTEGNRGFVNLPRLVLSDEGAVRVRSTLDTLYADGVPVVGPWHTYGPRGRSSRLFRAETRFTGFDRPSEGPDPEQYAGFPLRSGAAVSLFENTLTWKRGLRLRQLTVLRVDPYRGPYPVEWIHGRGETTIEVHSIESDATPMPRVVLERGDWLAVSAPSPSNLAVHFNHGRTVALEPEPAPRRGASLRGPVEALRVRAGDSLRYALFSVVDPVDASTRGRERALRLVRYLLAPDGLELVRGAYAADAPGAAGLLDLQVDDGAVTVRVPRPDRPLAAPLAVRVRGLNPRWSAGVFLAQDGPPASCGPREARYRAVGVDPEGRAYVPLFVDRVAVTQASIGHPVVSDRDELFVQVTEIGTEKDRRWHVSVNNPTDRAVVARFRETIDLPRLEIAPGPRSIPAGGYEVLVGGESVQSESL